MAIRERAALPGLLRLFVLQYVIFHALLCIEESKTVARRRWVQAMHDDLQRDDELAVIEGDWLVSRSKAVLPVNY